MKCEVNKEQPGVRHDEFIDHIFKAFREGRSYGSLRPGSDRCHAVICTFLYNIELQSFCITLVVVIQDFFFPLNSDPLCFEF